MPKQGGNSSNNPQTRTKTGIRVNHGTIRDKIFRATFARGFIELQGHPLGGEPPIPSASFLRIPFAYDLHYRNLPGFNLVMFPPSLVGILGRGATDHG